MKIGVCALPDKLPLLSELGYDYFETMFSWLVSLDDDAFREQTALVEKYGLAAEAYNIFFKRGMQIYAQDGNQGPILREIAAYANAGFARAAAWGGKVAVIGSGAVRAISEGMTHEEAQRQFTRVLSVCGEAADKHGMVVAIEPLSLSDCNYIHTVAEGADVAELSGHHAVGVMVDFYHHWNNKDDFDDLPTYADKLWHAHYARPGDRWVPEAHDEAHLKACADILKKCPNVKRVSLECRWGSDYERALRIARPQIEIFRNI